MHTGARPAPGDSEREVASGTIAAPAAAVAPPVV